MRFICSLTTTSCLKLDGLYTIPHSIGRSNDQSMSDIGA